MHQSDGKEKDYVEDKVEQHGKVAKVPTDKERRSEKDEPPSVAPAEPPQTQVSNSDERQPPDKGEQPMRVEALSWSQGKLHTNLSRHTCISILYVSFNTVAVPSTYSGMHA